MRGHDPTRVAAFGHPRIYASWRLPEAYRSLPRPSSAPGAKASPVRPSLRRARSLAGAPHAGSCALLRAMHLLKTGTLPALPHRGARSSVPVRLPPAPGSKPGADRSAPVFASAVGAGGSPPRAGRARDTKTGRAVRRPAPCLLRGPLKRAAARPCAARCAMPSRCLPHPRGTLHSTRARRPSPRRGVEPGGVEPPTSAVQRRRSPH